MGQKSVVMVIIRGHGQGSLMVTCQGSLVSHWSGSGHWSEVKGHWSVVKGHWAEVRGHWSESRVTGQWSKVTDQWSLVKSFSLTRDPLSLTLTPYP